LLICLPLSEEKGVTAQHKPVYPRNTTHPLVLKCLTPRWSDVWEEFIVKARLALVLDAMATGDGDQINAQTIQRVTQQLSVVVQSVGHTANKQEHMTAVLTE